MTKVILGNHTATYAARSEQDRIRKCYCDVLGCKAAETSDSVDHLLLDDVDTCFVWQDRALDEGDPPSFQWTDPPPKKWTGLGRSALGFGWADVAQG